ncbi:MAG: VWA domain-containing protein [Blastocatellia bacterium]|nr:VWA domain-containing protein [Blastocatellia bacterium]MBL8194347.1 VWA domain-containing protein [Blastocatellia bacterium]MBN8724898.1 VWA domain-containing protein [Acidobacteriota bacterium]
MKFANPNLLWLLLANLLILYLWYRQLKKPKTIKFSSLTNLKVANLKPSLRQRLRHLPVILRVIAFSCLIIALARPQSLSRVEQIKTELADIIVTVDTSLSMGALDFQTANRLSVAKEIISEFIDRRESDRLGLISFAAYSQLRCPLTLDYELLKTLLKNVDLVDRTDIEGNGTAIGIAIASSVNHLRHSDAKSRVVILLTDGDNNVTTIEPRTAAEIAQVLGIKIYTIGIGTSGMVKMPSLNIGDPPGTYTLQPSTFNENVLREIANSTGGKYYRATNRQALEDIFQEIDKLERTAVDVKRYEHYSEDFFYWLIMSICVLILEISLQHSYLRVLP